MDKYPGSPNRCPACGNVVRIGPFLPIGEMPCPCCRRLLWFVVIRGEPHFFLPGEVDSLDLVELVMDLEDDQK